MRADPETFGAFQEDRKVFQLLLQHNGLVVHGCVLRKRLTTQIIEAFLPPKAYRDNRRHPASYLCASGAHSESLTRELRRFCSPGTLPGVDPVRCLPYQAEHRALHLVRESRK